MTQDIVGAELANDRIEITFSDHGASYRNKEIVVTVPTVKWDSKEETWYAAKSWPVCHALRGVFGQRLVIGPALHEWATQMSEWNSYVKLIHDSEDVDGDDREYTFQRVGTQWLKAVRYGILADEMGTGKTVQACVALEELATLDHTETHNCLRNPVLIVAPKSVKRVWLAHLKEWAPSIRAEIVGGSAAARRKTLLKLDSGEIDCVIMNYESLRMHSRLKAYGKYKMSDEEKTKKELNREWSVVIADEAHRAKAPGAKQTRALWGATEHAQYRWAFTGTPIANSPEDLWSLLHFIFPEWWPTKTEWIDRYARKSWSFDGSGMNIDGLNPATEPEMRLTLDVHMLRRTKEEVLPWLPPIVEEERYVTLSPKERKAYKEMRDELVTELESGDELIAWNPMVKLTRLLQLANASLERDETWVPVKEDDPEEKFLLCEPSSKLDTLMDLLDDLGDKQVIIAAASRQLIELAEKRLEKAEITYGSVHGKVSADQRAANVDAFQEGKLRCMLLTVSAGGEGITLTAADTLIFLQRPFSNVQNVQTMARFHRLGQLAEQVTIIDLISEDTADERVFEILEGKQESLEEVVQDRKRILSIIKGD